MEQYAPVRETAQRYIAIHGSKSSYVVWDTFNKVSSRAYLEHEAKQLAAWLNERERLDESPAAYLREATRLQTITYKRRNPASPRVRPDPNQLTAKG